MNFFQLSCLTNVFKAQDDPIGCIPVITRYNPPSTVLVEIPTHALVHFMVPLKLNKQQNKSHRREQQNYHAYVHQHSGQGGIKNVYRHFT